MKINETIISIEKVLMENFELKFVIKLCTSQLQNGRATVLEKEGERVTGSHIINVTMSRYGNVRNGTTAGSGFALQ